MQMFSSLESKSYSLLIKTQEEQEEEFGAMSQRPRPGTFNVNPALSCVAVAATCSFRFMLIITGSFCEPFENRTEIFFAVHLGSSSKVTRSFWRKKAQRKELDLSSFSLWAYGL
jgi:hypothetical protein